MTGKELREYCKGKIVPIIFTEQIEDLEMRFEENTKAYIVGVSEANSDSEISINIEERDFSEFNKSIEKSNWLNRETGEFNLKFSDISTNKDWNGKDTLYDNEDELCGNFKLLDNNKLKLFKYYQDNNENNLTYIEWLENIAIKEI